MIGPVSSAARPAGECPGGAEYGHGFSRTTVHAGGCCERWAARPASSEPGLAERAIEYDLAENEAAPLGAAAAPAAETDATLIRELDELKVAYNALLHMENAPTYQVWTCAQKALALAGRLMATHAAAESMGLRLHERAAAAEARVEELTKGLRKARSCLLIVAGVASQQEMVEAALTRCEVPLNETIAALAALPGAAE